MQIGGNQLTFLIATDVHLGYREDDKNLGEDSYNAFKQVLEIAELQNVDFLLLGGDLFDEVNPTQKCLYKCINLLRNTVFGSRHIPFSVKGIEPNFSNENLNIRLPIFTIHGNHDYPSNDFGKLSVCDLLHASNYLNYFGKHVYNSAKQIVVSPILFRKQGLDRILAIYGLGYLKDSKLFQKLNKKQKVIFEELDQPHLYTKILVIHQNRYRGKKGGVGASYQNCVHANQFPEWLDLIIWGHEHEAITKIIEQSDRKIYQPGSTVITSCIEAESYKKQVVLIKIPPLEVKQSFILQPIMLQKSFRPLFWRSFVLEQLKQRMEEGMQFEEYFEKQLQSILQSNTSDKKPLIRIKIDYTSFDVPRFKYLEAKYKQKTANHQKIFMLQKKHSQKKRKTEELNDESVMDIIRNKKGNIYKGSEHVQTDQIIKYFTQEIAQTPFQYFQSNFFTDKITEFSRHQGHSYLSEMRQSMNYEVEKRYQHQLSGLKTFLKTSNETNNKLSDILLQKINNNLQGNLDDENDVPMKELVDLYQFKLIQRQKFHESEKPKSLSKKGGYKPLVQPSPISSQPQEQDCCVRAQKQKYLEHVTKENYDNAEKMVKQKEQQSKKRKKRKEVKFADN